MSEGLDKYAVEGKVAWRGMKTAVGKAHKLHFYLQTPLPLMRHTDHMYAVISHKCFWFSKFKNILLLKD